MARVRYNSVDSDPPSDSSQQTVGQPLQRHSLASDSMHLIINKVAGAIKLGAGFIALEKYVLSLDSNSTLDIRMREVHAVRDLGVVQPKEEAVRCSRLTISCRPNIEDRIPFTDNKILYRKLG